MEEIKQEQKCDFDQKTEEAMKQQEEALRAYVRAHIGQVLKEPRSFIRYPFIDPGSVYDGNVWDWDTYWSVYGLLSMMEDFSPELQQRILEHAKGNVRNFLDHQLSDGYIPMMIEVQSWPEPYLNMRHKEGVPMNMHKPFLCAQIVLISDYIGDYGWAAGFREQLERYFHYYKATYFHERPGLYVWQNDIMIGMDNDPASFGRPEDSTANIYLNSFMVHELQCMARYLEQTGQAERGHFYRQEAQGLTEAIQAECWDPRDQFFYSVDVDLKTRAYDWFHQGLGVFWNSLPIKIRVWSGFIPLWAHLATPAQAEALAKHSRDPITFASDFGICTLAKDEKMFNLEATNNPSNWLGPIWLVANYVVFRGLLDYGFQKEAEEICVCSLRLLSRDLEKTGSMHEYYHPMTGEPVMNGGFINWNILAVSMYRELHAARKENKAATGCQQSGLVACPKESRECLGGNRR